MFYKVVGLGHRIPPTSFSEVCVANTLNGLQPFN